MKFLIVNDDSIFAPGIQTLASAALELGEVWVVAPDRQCSAMSQMINIHSEMKLEPYPDFPVEVKAAYKLGGTPVDCVKVALYYIMDEKPDFVLSGINNGYNVGYDIAYSGTLGAAFEAARAGVPAIAFSTAGNGSLGAAKTAITEVLKDLIQNPPEKGSVWNVNFPSGKNGPFKGILKDRTAAAVSMYTEEYGQVSAEDGAVVLVKQGVPVDDAAIGPGTDARAVRDGYISVGMVRAF